MCVTDYECVLSCLVSCAVPQGAQLGPQHREALRACCLSVTSALNKVSAKHRDVHQPVSRLGRAIDKVNEQYCLSLSL